MDNGHEALAVGLPAVFTVVKEINEPRLPSLKGKTKAKKAEIRRLGAAEIGIDLDAIGLKGSPTAVSRIFSPPKRGGGERIDGGDAATAAKIVIGKLREAMVVA